RRKSSASCFCRKASKMRTTHPAKLAGQLRDAGLAASDCLRLLHEGSATYRYDPSAATVRGAAVAMGSPPPQPAPRALYTLMRLATTARSLCTSWSSEPNRERWDSSTLRKTPTPRV